MISLAKAFHEYQVVFKPYADEFQEFTQWVMEACGNYKNIQLSKCGSHYSKLHAKSALMVSDLSSTAYTFAFSTCRPVIFYSPRESELQDYLNKLGSDAYLENRKHVGVIVISPEALVHAVKDYLDSRETWSDKIYQVRHQELFQVGESAEYLAKNFDKIIAGGKSAEWKKIIFIINIQI